MNAPGPVRDSKEPDRERQGQQEPSELGGALARLVVKKGTDGGEHAETDKHETGNNESSDITPREAQFEVADNASSQDRTGDYDVGLNEQADEPHLRPNSAEVIDLRNGIVEGEISWSNVSSGPPEENIDNSEGQVAVDQTGQAQHSEQSGRESTSNEPLEASPATGGGNGNIPPEPPEASSTSAGQPPERPGSAMPDGPGLPPSYYESAQGTTTFGSQAAATTAGETITKDDLEDAVYRATKVGQNRGVLAGLLAGAGFEHIRHRRREKKAEKRYKAQDKKNQANQQAYKFSLEEQQRQKHAVERRLANAERNLAGTEQRLKDAMQTNQTMGEVRRQTAVEEHPLPLGTERRFIDTLHQKERSGVVPEQPDTADQQATVPSDRRRESSAWHSIEVDAKTGKPVETPTFQYGREYYRERASEKRPVQQRHAAAGEAMLAAAIAAGQQSSATSGKDNAASLLNVPSATMQGPPPSQAKQNAPKTTSRDLVSASRTSAPLWPWILALLVVIMCLVLILR